MTPSAEQEAYFQWLISGSGNALVSAVAGSGKTTTLCHGLRHMEGSICAMAYNKKAATEMSQKAQDLGLGSKASIGTVHSFGYAILRGQKIFPKPDEWARFGKLAEKFSLERETQIFFKNALSMAKQRGFGLPGQPGLKDEAAWTDMADTFSLYDDLPETLIWEAALPTLMNLLQSSKYDYKDFIDFDDMIWLPLALELPAPKYNWVLLDEAQDTNPARRCLARNLLHKTGRFVAVGDPAQAIYGFTGADNDSLTLIEREFGTTSLPLHTSFRCGKAIIEEARKYVSHIQAFAENPEGLVQDLEISEKNSQWLAQVHPGDVILCRNTRPLIRLAFQLIKAGRAAKVEGRKIGEGLKALAKKFKSSTREEFDAQLSSYNHTETKKLIAKKKNFAAALINDKTESLFVIADTLSQFSKQSLLDKIDSIFAETSGVPRTAILLCTIHRAKGLEWDRVFWHLPSKYQPSSFAKQDWEFEQENNLCYVAITRAKRELVITKYKGEIDG